MREICLDEGTLQSYLDGELSLDMTEQVAGHVAACNACAELLSEAEGELAMFSAAFAAEASWPVPSEELRVRINRAIEAVDVPVVAAEREQGRASRLPAWLGSFANAFAFKPQHAAAFASLFVIVAFGLIFAALYRQSPAPAGTSHEPVVASIPATGPVKATDPPADGGNGPVIQGTQPFAPTPASLNDAEQDNASRPGEPPVSGRAARRERLCAGRDDRSGDDAEVDGAARREGLSEDHRFFDDGDRRRRQQHDYEADSARRVRA
jgi:hypothetical protein